MTGHSEESGPMGDMSTAPPGIQRGPGEDDLPF